MAGAKSSSARFLCLLLCSSFLMTAAAASDHINVGMVSKVLSEKGYNAMSMTLDALVESNIVGVGKNSTTTLLCPPDHAFLSSKYAQPPLTLLKYHAVPLKLDEETLETRLPYGSKLETLLPGHPLVVTTVPGTAGSASLNGVRITEWNVYNDGDLVIHGVEDFFDPAFQTLLYPRFDVHKEEQKEEGRLSWMNMIMQRIIIGAP